VKRIALICALLLAGCATLPTDGGGRCNAGSLRPFIGAIATSDFRRVALRRSGAKTLRWIQPGTAVTMDYRTDRLNVRLDARNFITGVDCG